MCVQLIEGCVSQDVVAVVNIQVCSFQLRGLICLVLMRELLHAAHDIICILCKSHFLFQTSSKLESSSTQSCLSL